MSSITSCRSCASTQLHNVLDLGLVPLANALVAADRLSEPEFNAALAVVFCQSCALLQITQTVPPERLFTDYTYMSSFSDTMLLHARTLAERLIVERGLNADSLVVEIASNDGYLLQNYLKASVPVLGIDPARNVAKIAIERGIDTLVEFFGQELGSSLASAGKRADLIHAHNVFAHVPDINGFLTGIRDLLKDDGIALIEFPYAGDMLANVEFDTIYHEHVFYFSLTSVQNACRRNGLQVVDVERLPIHGGSLRVFISKSETVRPSVLALLAEERTQELHQYSAHQNFGAKVQALKSELLSLLAVLKSGGHSIAAYGAAAKGSTLLNFMGIDGKTLDFVVDRSTVKQGKYMAGVHLPILEPQALVSRKPDYVLLLTWNFAEEILAQQKEYLDGGGQFIVPIPRPVIVGRQSAPLPSAHKAAAQTAL